MKFKVCKSREYHNVHSIYVKRWFGWCLIGYTSETTIDEVITKAREIAESYMKKPVVEFEIK